ncbi:hypothetical protein, partial [Klebsiella quasivariicola]|uniref:hypothetical protein n=1 Tax=Klebsiella quasivariicola TaxID=2026240 RepID=UPI002B0627AD
PAVRGAGQSQQHQGVPSADAALIVIHSRRSAFHALIDRRELRLAYSGLNFLKAIDRDAS